MAVESSVVIANSQFCVLKSRELQYEVRANDISSRSPMTPHTHTLDNFFVLVHFDFQIQRSCSGKWRVFFHSNHSVSDLVDTTPQTKRARWHLNFKRMVKYNHLIEKNIIFLSLLSFKSSLSYIIFSRFAETSISLTIAHTVLEYALIWQFAILNSSVSQIGCYEKSAE